MGGVELPNRKLPTRTEDDSPFGPPVVPFESYDPTKSVSV